MRLSEKTIELNFCSQLNASLGNRLLWFGLTQKQEARAGFDTCTKVRGRLLLFQFKASDYVLTRSGFRRFYLAHDQLKALQSRAGCYMRSVFYAFPLIGSTRELAHDSNLMSQTGLLDMATVPPLKPPTKADGSPRKNKIHYADVRPWKVTVHSEPVELRLESAEGLADRGFAGADGANFMFESFDDFWHFCRIVRGTLAGAVLTPRP